MKKILWMAIMLMALVGCGTTRLTMEQRQAMEQMVANRGFTVDVDYCMPMAMPAKSLTSEYSVRLSPDTLHSALPYFGRAYNVPYGGGTGLNFDAPIEEASSLTRKGDERLLTVSVSHEGDKLVYYFHIFDNGKVNIDVLSRERDKISFSGRIRN